MPNPRTTVCLLVTGMLYVIGDDRLAKLSDRPADRLPELETLDGSDHLVGDACAGMQAQRPTCFVHHEVHIGIDTQMSRHFRKEFAHDGFRIASVQQLRKSLGQQPHAFGARTDGVLEPVFDP